MTEGADFLAGMAASSRARSAAAQAATPAKELRARIADLPPAPRLASRGFDLIAGCENGRERQQYAVELFELWIQDARL